MNEAPLFGMNAQQSSENPIQPAAQQQIPQNLIDELSLYNDGFERVPLEEFKNFYIVYFLEIHLKSENNLIELNIDSSHKYAKPLNKIDEKAVKRDNEEFLISVFSFIIDPAKIKKKEIINDIVNMKLNLKYKKEKFENIIQVKIDQDNFMGKIEFGISKGWFGKQAQPPKTFTPSDFEMFKIFFDALQIKERKTIKNPEFLELLKYGVQLYMKNQENEFEFYLILFANILNSNDQDLIKQILNIFDIEKIKKQSPDSIPMRFQENFDNFYEDQTKLLAKLMLQKNKSNQTDNETIYREALDYMIIFYTVYIYYLNCSNNEFIIQKVLTDISNNNKFDYLMIAKLYLSKFSSFYYIVPINLDLKHTLMSKLLILSKNFYDISKTFSFAANFFDRDFEGILRVSVDNYDKLNQICMTEKNNLNINNYITPKQNDDLKKIMEYLSMIYEKKLSMKYLMLYIEINTWDFYLKDEKNKEFLEFLKKNLIYSSLTYEEIVESLKFLSQYLNKNIVSVLEIIINNYEKICEICRPNNNYININDFIIQTNGDDYNKLKEQLTCITSKKINDKYETVYFTIEIWLYYIQNNFDQEFLKFLQMKLFEAAFNYRDICNCLLYSSTFKNKDFACLLEIINNNFEIIYKICLSEKKTVSIVDYINQKFDDDLSTIKNLIKFIVDKELACNFDFIDFNVNLWKKYFENDNLDQLILIRSIIYVCQKINPKINEEIINLAPTIHIGGLKLIKQEKLEGDKLVKFLGEDEIYYDEKNKKLESENERLKDKVKNIEGEITNLKKENSSLKSKISSMEKIITDLQKQFSDIKNTCKDLKSDIKGVKSDVSMLKLSNH